MGGGRDARGALIYIRRNGIYYRRDGKSINHKNNSTKNAGRFIQTLGYNEIEKRSKEIESTHQYKSEFSRKIRDSKTIEELLNVVYEKYGKNDDPYQYLVLRARNFEMVKRVLVTVNELEEQYPFTKGFIYDFGAVTDDNIAGFSMSSGTLRLSSDWNEYNSPNLYSPPIRAESIPNTTPESIIAHEFGHVLQARIFHKQHPNLFTNGKFNPPDANTGNDMIKEYVFGKFMIEIEKSVLKNLNMSFYEAHTNISNYARDNGVMEAFADAFADVYANGDNASVVSKAYTKALIEAAK